MSSYQIKQSSTAYPLVFLLVQSSDHISGLTGATPTVTISKAGAAFASPAGAVSEIGNGWYKVAGNAADAGTLGPLLLHATAASGDPCDMLYEVVAHDVQDAVRLGLSALPNAAASAAGGLLTFGSSTGQVNPSSGKVPATLAATDVTGNVAADLQTIKTQTVTCSAGVTVNVNLGTTQPLNFTGTAASALVKSDTVDIAGSAVSATTAQLGVNVVNIKGTASAGVAGYVGIDWSHVNAPTTAVNLSGTTISTGQTIANVTVGGYAAGQDPATLVLDVAAASHNTAGTIGAAINAASAPTAAQVATAVWTDLLASSDFSTAASIGALLKADVGADTSGTTTLLTRLTSTRAGYLDNLSGGAVALHTDITGLHNIAAGDVWDVTLASHLTSGTTGAALNAAGSAGDPWATTLPGAYGAGTAGYIVGTNLDAAVSTRSTFAGGAVASVTGNVGGNVAGSVGSISGVTFPAHFGALVIDSSGNLTAGITGNITGNVSGSVGSISGVTFPANFAALAITASTGLVGLNLAQTGLAPRALDAVADSSLTVGDGLVCAIAAATGKEDVSGTSYVIKTPSSGTTIRTFTLDSSSSPTSRS